jgi:hypothetical protein
MARGWGGRPPDLKGTLGTLIRTTLIQLAGLRDAARAELDNRREWAGGVLVDRKRTQVLAGLGEIIVELARAGELELSDFPEVQRAIAELAEIDSSRPPEVARREPIGVWRPPVDGDDPVSDEIESAPTRPTRRRGSDSASHITFVTDELMTDELGGDDDLADYMHDDDVPESDT